MYIEFKPGEKHAAKGADTADKPDNFPDAGYLAEPDEAIVDIDGLSQAQTTQLITRIGTKTQYVLTDRGVHLYYRKPPGFTRAFNGVCALGFEIETKTSTNCPNGITIKRNGVMREIVNPGVREVLPWYFFNNRKQYQNMNGVGEGGRNNLLFAHKQKLDNHPDTEWICRFINEVLFDTPLDEREFESVMRDYKGPNGGSEYDLASNIINTYGCVVYQGGIWWRYGGEYITDQDNRRLLQLVFNMCPGKNTRYVEEIVKQVEIRCKQIDTSDLPIVFQNGFLEDGEFIEFEGFTEFSPYHIPIKYDPDAPAVEAVDKYIDQLTDGDPDYKLVLGEALGYCFITNPVKIKSIARFFIIRGNGANGKSTLLAIIRLILGPRNCTALSIKELTDTRYRASMRGMLANLGDDIEKAAIGDAEMRELKTITSADTTEIRPLYHHSERLTLTCKLFFTSNSDLKTSEKGYALKRRLMLLPMFNVVEKPDPKFIEKLTTPDALCYWVRLAVEGYKRLYENLAFTYCKKLEDYSEMYHRFNNHMSEFLHDVNMDLTIIGKTPTEVQEAYREWNDEPRRTYSSKLLKEELAKQGIGLGMKTVNGKQSRVFMRQKDTTQNLFA